MLNTREIAHKISVDRKKWQSGEVQLCMLAAPTLRPVPVGLRRVLSCFLSFLKSDIIGQVGLWFVVCVSFPSLQVLTQWLIVAVSLKSKIAKEKDFPVSTKCFFAVLHLRNCI